MINYKIIKLNDSALKILGKDNWQLICIDDGKMYFSKKVVNKKDREDKQATKSPEFIEFARIYPKKAVLSSDKLIEKYNQLVGQHQEIMEGVKRYINYIEVEKLAPRFIKNATTFINNKCWENEYKTLENRFGFNKKFVANMLQGYDSKFVDKVLNQIKIWETKNKSEIREGVLKVMIEKGLNNEF